MNFVRIYVVALTIVLLTTPARAENNTASPFQSEVPDPLPSTSAPAEAPANAENKPPVKFGETPTNTSQASTPAKTDNDASGHSQSPIPDSSGLESAPPPTAADNQSSKSNDKPVIAVPPPLLARGPNIKKLSRKFRGKSLALLIPLDYTSLSLSEPAVNSMKKALEAYGNPKISLSNESIESLTLEQFRKIIIRTHSEIVFLTLIKPDMTTIYIYDRRTPYNLYTSEQPVPKQLSDRLTPEVLLKNLMATLDGVLESYINDDRYELTREEPAQDKTTREIASLRATRSLLQTINKELVANYYLSVGLGGTLGVGQDSDQVYNTLSAEAGFRLNRTLYLEAGLDSFSYNSLSLLFKYLSTNVETPYRFGFGVGPAFGINRAAIAFDPNLPDGAEGKWLVGTATFMIPTLDVYFKLESKVFVGLGGAKDFFSFAPGMTFLF